MPQKTHQQNCKWEINLKNTSYEFIVYKKNLKPAEFQMAEDPPTWGDTSKAWWAQWENGSQEIHEDKSSA